MPISEEPLDKFLNRPLAKPIVAALFPLGVTANQITLLAMVTGVTGGVAIALGTRAWIIAAAALLEFFLILDCADGEMARRRGGGSRLGAVLDGISDYATAISVHVGLLLLGWKVIDGPKWAVFAVVAATGFSKALHAAMFDAAKQRFRGRSWEPVDQIRGELSRATTAGDRFVLTLYLGYVKGQHVFGSARPAPSQGEFLAWCVLGPTLRMTVLAGSLVASLWEPRALLVYPAFGLVFANAWMAVLSLTARRPSPGAAPGSSPP